MLQGFLGVRFERVGCVDDSHAHSALKPWNAQLSEIVCEIGPGWVPIFVEGQSAFALTLRHISRARNLRFVELVSHD